MSGCKEANIRLKGTTAPALRGETTHPMHIKQGDGIDQAKAMYNRFYKKQ